MYQLPGKMRKRLVIIIIGLVVSQSQAQTSIDVQKAKSSAKLYLMKKLNNPGSYTSASWDKLSKTYTDFYDSKDRKIIDDSLSYYHNASGLIKSKMHQIRMGDILKYEKDSAYKSLVAMSDQVDSAVLDMQAKREIKEKLYKPIFDGYRIEHSFRARNKFNALVLQNWFFVFNKSFKVIAAGDADELELERQKLQREIDELTNKKY
jgi:hypothetical protein